MYNDEARNVVIYSLNANIHVYVHDNLNEIYLNNVNIQDFQNQKYIGILMSKERERESESERERAKKGEGKVKGKRKRERERERTKARAILLLTRLGQSEKSSNYTVLYKIEWYSM
jgi:hypothetical protein